MLQNAYFLGKTGADTAEIELHFAEMLPIGRRVGRPEKGGAAVLQRLCRCTDWPLTHCIPISQKDAVVEYQAFDFHEWLTHIH